MNVKDLTYRQRVIFMLISVVVFFVLSYFLAIKNTIVLYTESEALQVSMGEKVGAANELVRSRKRYQEVNNYLKLYSSDSLKNQQFIMSEISDLCRIYKLTLKNFPKAALHVERDLNVETNVIEIEGAFTSQLKFIHALETTHLMGRVSSVKFNSYTDTKSKQSILLSTIYLQNIKSNEPAQL